MLHLSDLCAVAATCKRFGSIAQRVAPKKFEFGVDGDGECRIYCNGVTYWYRAEEVSIIFKNFGSALTDLSVNGNFGSYCKYIINLMSQHCSNLKSVTFLALKITKAFAIQLKPIFKMLQKLHLHSVSTINDVSLFSGLNLLVDMKVRYVEGCGAILKNSFPKLQRFHYGKNDIVAADSICYPAVEQSLELLTDFLTRHKNLKELVLRFDRCIDTMQIVNMIGNNCQKVEELAIDCGLVLTAVSLQLLASMKSLRSLSLGSMNFENFELFPPLPGLKELCLTRCELPESCNQFYSFTQLTKLSVYLCDVNIDVVGIVKRLTNLEELEICLGWRRLRLDEETFCKIVDIVNGRPGGPKRLTLRCDFCFDETKWKRNENVILVKQ